MHPGELDCDLGIDRAQPVEQRLVDIRQLVFEIRGIDDQSATHHGAGSGDLGQRGQQAAGQRFGRGQGQPAGGECADQVDDGSVGHADSSPDSTHPAPEVGGR